MNKLCNVKPVRVVYGVGPRPFDTERRMVLSGKDIIMCMAYGQVEEVLIDGTTRILDQSNYLVDDNLTIHDIDGFINGNIEVKPVLNEVVSESIKEEVIEEQIEDEDIVIEDENKVIDDDSTTTEEALKNEFEEDKVPTKQPSKKNSKKK